MSLYYSKQMNNNPPQFAQLSNINKVKDVKKKPTVRPGFYADMLKGKQANVWRTLHNY